MLRMLTYLFALMGISVLFSSCKSLNDSRLQSELAPPTWEGFEAAWNSYLAHIPQSHPYQIQERCKPLLYKPEGTPKGVVLFYHGFTACPMQFTPFAERMQALGYYVIVPLLPGQGRGPTPLQSKMVVRDVKAGERTATPVSFSEYYGRYLPTEEVVYEAFIQEMNGIVAQAPGRHVVGGLSVGGALTTRTLLLAYQGGYGELYDHALAISPYYGMPGLYLGRKGSENAVQALFNALQRPVGDAIYQMQKGLVTGSESLKVLGNIPVSFGAKCYDSICGDRLPECSQKYKGLEATGGRDAICDFKIGNLAALEEQGKKIREGFMDLSQNWIRTKHQIVGTEFDGSADSALMIALGDALRTRAPDRGQFCLYAPYKGQKIGHVVFDLTEQPFAPMPWRKSFIDQAVAFMDKGEFFASTPGAQNPNCTVPYE